MRALLVALSAVTLASAAFADGVDRAPLRGSAAYEAPAYPVEVFPRAYPSVPVEAAVATQSYGRDLSALPFAVEFGGRYWMSFGRLAKSLYDLPESSPGMVSRLTYDGLTAHAAEGFFRANHPIGLLLKGYVGFAGLKKGGLNDEDFAPFIDPYSSTMSDQRGGHLHYATVDLGYTFWTTPQMGFAGFVGYNYLGEKAHAYGCTQVATNPFVCVPTITGEIRAITEDAQFHSLRLGVAGELKLFDRLLLTAEAAWLPFVNMRAADTHWLRIGTLPGDFAGAIPQNGHGHGIQLEALLAYRATANLSFGVGARYWRLETEGTAEFNGVVVGFTAAAQPVEFTTERYGFFLQGAYRL